VIPVEAAAVSARAILIKIAATAGVVDHRARSRVGPRAVARFARLAVRLTSRIATWPTRFTARLATLTGSAARLTAGAAAWLGAGVATSVTTKTTNRPAAAA
jgi:hypothetical protein